MGKLIEEAAVLAALERTPYWQAEDKFRSKQAVQSCPSVDAVPVIRCKDCKKYWDSSLGYGQCEKHGFDSVMPDGFCSYAEPVNKPVESVNNS